MVLRCSWTLVEGLMRNLVLGHRGDGVGAGRFYLRADEGEGQGNGVSWCVSVLLICGGECGAIGSARSQH